MKIKKIERIPNDLVEEMYWPPAANYHLQITFDNKQKLIVFQDPEGNGSGVFRSHNWLLTEESANKLIGATVRHFGS